MIRSWTIVVAAMLAAAAVAIPSSAATRPAAFTDATGDARDGAPDLAEVALVTDSDGGFTVRVKLATMPDLAPNGELWVFLDTDLDSATGERGTELVFVATAQGVGALKWNGSAMEPFAAQASPRLTGDGLEFRLAPALALKRFELAVLSSTAESTTYGDSLDGNDHVYPLPSKATRVLVPATALTVRAGSVLDLRAVRVETDANEIVRPNAVTCSLRLGSVALAPLPGGCRWRIPKAMKGKRLVLAVTATLGDSRVSQRLAVRPR